MKNLYKSILLLIMLLAQSSCSDFLERDHPTAIGDDQYWTTITEVANAYGQLKRFPHGTYHYTEPYMGIVHMEGMSDNMYHSANFRSEIVEIGNGSHTPTTGGYIDMIFQEYYRMIRRCNRLLENIDRAYFTDQAEKRRYKAETRVWRAWYHMQLLYYYGGTNGIPIADRVLAPDEIYLPRNTVQECLDFLNKEFDDVINSTDTEFIWDEGRRSDRMSRSIALALKMQVNLQYKQYGQAKDAAFQLISSRRFELYYSDATDGDKGKNFRDLFRYRGRQNPERILFTREGLAEFWFRSMSTTLTGQGATNPIKSIVDEFETIDGQTIQSLSSAERQEYEKNPLYKPRDPRLYATILLPGDNTSISGYTYLPFNASSSDAVGKPGASRSGYGLKKFADEQDRAEPWAGRLDFVIIRYAEVLLSYVECLIETGNWQDPDVEKYINQIRERAGMPAMDKAIYNTQEKVRELYRRERRVELAFEGVRYWDIRRWDIGVQTMRGRVEGAWNPDTQSFVVVEERNFEAPKHNVWPLPQREITANPNIKQPTGWD
ncbi:RagB/SusD family nutrient uptake outer membrane protein [Dysgonomonas reticulitermitis]